jgi:hypothetical protein
VDVGKSQMSDPIQEDSPADYCRAIEAYVCRKNDGHLIRIVGPAFEMVCGWAARGVPMTVAQRGIDRYFERYYAKGPRRRPVRVEFCEADVLDAFDEWRRAVGVTSTLEDPDTVASGESTARRESLPAHLERVVARLTAMRAGGRQPLDSLLDAIIQELDAARAGAKGLRGRGRAELLERLTALDSQLLAAVRDQMSEVERNELRREAEAELALFHARMPHDALERSIAACIDRLLRDRCRLPTLSLE